MMLGLQGLKGLRRQMLSLRQMGNFQPQDNLQTRRSGSMNRRMFISRQVPKTLVEQR